MSVSIKLGTRGSPLALAQTTELRERLIRAHPETGDIIEVVVIRTTGDRITDRALAKAGGKGLFTKELDEALIDRRIDIAVHSAKDLPTILPGELAIAGYLPREDVRDALIALRFGSLATLPLGAHIGTASVRREAQLKRLRPDLRVSLLRGNVETRLRKLVEGECDATLLALAGLKRLGLADKATQILDTTIFLPAVGQGAIALVTRREDAAVMARLAPVLDAPTAMALAAERAFLNELDGSCRTPIAGYAAISGLEGTSLNFRGLALRQDGTDAVEVVRQGDAQDAARLGADAAAELLARLPAGVLVARELRARSA
ncbi:hydroxymethylbilane synthase [Rhizobiales bacterium GAS191]|nr:hydroxymethylbilane synthase [Rhizobiales bacterium GAS113]SEE75039.1 hydroxymethylbilane synthase [Rhizobiales bacterium GAS191]